MSNNRTLTVSYLGVDKKSKDNSSDHKIKQFKDYSTSGIKRYNNAISALAGISGVARDLLEWLTVRMDNGNYVYSTESVRSNFILHIQECRDKSKKFDYKIPSDRAVKAAFAKLKNSRLLINHVRGEYIVNPEYFMNPQNEDYRGKLIKLILEFQDEKETAFKRELVNPKRHLKY